MSVDRTVFVGMLREEWRLHARLFGGVRFAAFPLLVAVIGTSAAWLLVSTGTEPSDLVAGLEGLVFVFGLHTGTIGFVGRDAIRDLLGDVTLLVFTSRTLPTSPRRLVAIFLAKDAVYYAMLFLLPLSIGVWVIVAPTSLSSLALLWATVTGTFVLGVLVTFALIGLGARRALPSVGVIGALVLALNRYAGVDPLEFTPFGLYRSPGLAEAAWAFLPLVGLAAIGMAVYDPTRRRPSRTTVARLETWRERLHDDDGLLTKSLVDVARSSGGLGKVLFSGGVLFGVTAFLVGVVERLTGVRPSAGVSFGALLGLTAFTTYNWLTQFDDPSAYRPLPISTGALFRAKFRAFLILGFPTAIGYYLLGVILFRGRPAEVVAGAVLVVGVLLYLFGLTVGLAGFEPNEFLFDTVLFLTFAVAVTIALVPVLIVGFVLVPLGRMALGGVVVWGALLGAVGTGLYRWSIPRWTDRYRRR